MKPRSAPRPARATTALRVRLGGRDLPDLVASPPRGRWTRESGSAAAWRYADEHEDDVDDVRRPVLARCAWLAITRTDPALSRADAEARLRGEPAAPGPDPLDVVEEPFDDDLDDVEDH